MHEEKTTKRALVTGASSGLGEGLAQRLAADGYEVWLAARRADRLEEVAARIRGAGGVAHSVILDVGDYEAAARKVVELDEACGGFELVVANAGVSGTARPHKLGWETARDNLVVNLLGAAATLVPVVPRMVARGHGHVVGISSLSAELPLPLGATYGAAKAGLSHMLLAMRPALALKGVAVTVIEPGFIRTAMTENARVPMPFMLDAEEAVDIIHRAIIDKRALVRFPARLSVAIGVARVLPRRLRDWFIRRARA